MSGGSRTDESPLRDVQHCSSVVDICVCNACGGDVHRSRSGYESSESDELSDESGAADDSAKLRSKQVVHKGRWSKEEVSPTALLV